MSKNFSIRPTLILIASLTLLTSWPARSSDNDLTLTLHNALDLRALCESGKADSFEYPKFILSEKTLHNLVKIGLKLKGIEADCQDRVDIAVAEGDYRVELIQEEAANTLAEITALYEDKLSWSFEWWHVLVAGIAGVVVGGGVALGLTL